MEKKQKNLCFLWRISYDIKKIEEANCASSRTGPNNLGHLTLNTRTDKSHLGSYFMFMFCSLPSRTIERENSILGLLFNAWSLNNFSIKVFKSKVEVTGSSLTLMMQSPALIPASSAKPPAVTSVTSTPPRATLKYLANCSFNGAVLTPR